jgi:hypothetical protein
MKVLMRLVSAVAELLVGGQASGQSPTTAAGGGASMLQMGQAAMKHKQ